MPTTLLRGGLLFEAGGSRYADVLIKDDGTVLEIGTVRGKVDNEIDARRKLIYAAFIDCHGHFREPGLTHKETIATGSRSSLEGGVTTFCEMPNTVPPTVTIAAFAEKVRIAAETACIDMRFFFGMTEPAHLEEFLRMMDSDAEDMKALRARCCGVKLYFDHSTGDQKVDASMIGDVFAACAARDIQIVGHCEDPLINAQASKKGPDGIASSHSLRRPAAAEASSIAKAMQLAKDHNARFHVAHLSTGVGARILEDAQKNGVRATGETAPHYLYCTIDDYAALGARIKMNPPMRTAEDRDALWEAIKRRVITVVSTDHAPHTLEEKSHADPLRAPSGVPGTETMIRLMLTAASGRSPRPDGWRPPVSLSYGDVRRLCFDEPNRIFQLRKPDIIAGQSPNIVIIDPYTTEEIRAENLHSKAGWTPFAGWQAHGKVERVLRGGKQAWPLLSPAA